MIALNRIRGLHIYTGDGYNVTTSMLNALDGRRLNVYIIHLGHPDDASTRFDRLKSKSHRAKVISKSISYLEDFLRVWKRSDIAGEEMYISLPMLHNNSSTIEKADEFYSDYVDYMKQVKSTIVDRLGQTYWDKDFAGFYFSTEAIYPIQEKLDSSRPTSNPMVKLLNDLSYRIRNTYERYFMWCPYYGYGANRENIAHNIGVIANRTNIFDVICIQPATYYHSAPDKNVNLVYRSARNDEVVDVYGDPVAGGKRSSATAFIGVNMEGDSDFNKSKRAIFNDYIDTFSPLINDVPIVFYGNTLEVVTGTPGLLDAIEDFYRS
ncbi:hypothetical protein [Brevibacillus borstelensis]